MVKQDLIARLEDIDLNYYFGSLSAEELTQLILS